MSAATTFHMCLDVRGALKTFTRRQLACLFRNRETGKSLSADEAREVLLDYVAQGAKVIPLGPVCEGFDYSGNGCPGHEERAQ